MAKIGLVTVLYKSDEVLEGFFKSLSNQSYKDYHLYMIDNTPNEFTNELIQRFQKLFPIESYTLIQNEENVGVACGNNQGINMSILDGCTHTLLLNNDIEFNDSTVLEKIYSSAVEKNEFIVVPKILFYGTKIIWMAGGRFLNNLGITEHLGEGMEDESLYNKATYSEYAPTCFMLINNNVFKSVGMMDERYFVYYDDTDFIFRARKGGYKIFYLPEIEIYHKVSTSTGGNESAVSIYYCNRNRIYFIRKNFTSYYIFTALSYTLLSRAIKLFIYDRNKRRILMKAIVDGFNMKIS